MVTIANIDVLMNVELAYSDINCVKCHNKIGNIFQGKAYLYGIEER